jgi:hypothetical protein
MQVGRRRRLVSSIDFLSDEFDDLPLGRQSCARGRGDEFTSRTLLDFDPECGIPAGRNWEGELYSGVARADDLILVRRVPPSIGSTMERRMAVF